jgi:hypothetical protein
LALDNVVENSTDELPRFVVLRPGESGLEFGDRSGREIARGLLCILDTAVPAQQIVDPPELSRQPSFPRAAEEVPQRVRFLSGDALEQVRDALARVDTLQAALGIVTLLHQTPVALALAHQMLAIAAFTVAVIHAERLSHSSPVRVRQTATAEQGA